MIIRYPDPRETSVTPLMHLRMREHLKRGDKKIVKTRGDVQVCCESVSPGNNREA